MFSASVAARHPDGVFVSGFGFAASHYGVPDIGLIAWSDIARSAWPTAWRSSSATSAVTSVFERQAVDRRSGTHRSSTS